MNLVVSNQKSPEKNDKLYNEFDHIKDSLNELKSLKQEIDFFDNEKKDLQKEVLEQKSKEIEQKKLDFENKKKEVEESIKEADELLKQEKTIDEKLIWLEEKIALEAELLTYKKELENLKLEVWFWWKIKETWNNIWEYAKENPGKTALIATGVGLAIWGISKLFKKKEKKEGDESSNEKPWFFKRALKWLGIWVWWILVWKNRDWIKDKASDLRNSITGKSNETIPWDGNVASWSFEKLSEAQKQKYFQLSEDISTFSTSSESSFDVNLSDNTEKDKELKWGMLHWLDKKLGNLSNFWNKEMLDFMYEKSTDDYIEKIWQWTKKQVHELLWDYLGSIASFQPFWTKFISDPVEAIKDWLAESVDRKEQLALFFKFYLNTFNYVSEKQKILKVQFAKSIVMWKDRLNQEQSDKEQDAIEDLLFSDEFKENTYVEFLKKYTLADVPHLMNEYNIEVDQISESTQDLRDNLQENREDAFSTDENWETCIVRAEAEFLEWWLSEWIRWELTDLCEWMLDDSLVWTNRKSFFDAYTHLITDIFAGDEEYAKKIREKLEIERLATEIRATLVWYLEKLKNNTFDKQDLDELKSKSESYFNVRERMEITLHNLEDYSGWFWVDWWKLAQLPIDAFKDVWKAFGLWKTNSWWERVGYGLGWLYVSGHSLYIASKVIPWWNVIGFVGRWAVEIWKLPVTWLQRWFRLATWRRYLPGLWLDWWRWQLYLQSSGFTNVEKSRLLKYAFIHWELNERQALRIAQKLSDGWTVTLTDTSDLLRWFWITNDEHIKLYEKYKNNKNIRQILFTKWKNIKAELYNPKELWQYNVTNRRLKINYIYNVDHFNELQKIDEFLWKATHQWKKAIINWFLETTKSLRPEFIDEIFKTKTFDHIIAEESKNIWRILGKHMHKFDKLDDFKQREWFFFRHYKDANATEAFVANSLRNWKKIKLFGGDATKEAAYISEKSLHRNAFQKQVEWMKRWFTQAAEKLKKIKVPKQFQSKVSQSANNLTNLANTSEENFRLLRWGLGDQAWAKNMKNNKSVMDAFKNAFKNKEVIKALKTATTSNGIKDALKLGWISDDIINQTPKQFLKALECSKNTHVIKDSLKYVDKIEDIGKIWKILKSPYMKVAWRVVGKIVAVAAPIMWWINAFMTYQEAKEISKHNQERGDFKRQKWHWETTMAVLWWVDAAIAIWWTTSVVWAIPAWIVSGVLTWILWLAEWVKYYAYDSFDKYSKNYLDFAGESELIIKQHISTVLMGKNKIDTWLWDVIARQFKDMSHLADKTSGEWIKALLYTQEREKNPLAMENTNDVERMKQLSAMQPPITREMIVQAQNEVDSKVNQKYMYFEKKCGTVDIDGKTVINIQKIITTDIIERGESMKELDKLFREAEFSVNNLDIDPDVYKLRLDEYPDKYDKLEKLWNTDIRSLVYFHRFSYDYKQLMENYLLDDDWNSIEDKKELIDQNLDYINDFVSYKSLSTWKDISLLLPPQNEENDMEKIRNFLITLSIDKQPSSKEIFGSDNKFQNVLYRIATEIVGARIQNTKEDLLKIFDEEHEKKYGIYFKKLDFNKLCVNGNYFGDQEYVVNTYNMQKFKEDLQKKIDKNDLIDIWTWDKILNKEIGDRYIKIINEEIERK